MSGQDQIPEGVIEAIQAGTTTVTRRVEIFEKDGITPWDPEENDQYDPRVIDGSVSVDYNRDERRTADFSFDNRDQLLRPEPSRGFWYDKVIKVWRGVVYPSSMLAPKIAIVDAPDNATAYQIRATLAAIGYDRTDVKITASGYAAVKGYDIFVSYNPTGNAGANISILKDAFNHGKGVLTFGNQYTTSSLPFVIATGATVTKAVNINPSTQDSPLRGGWIAQATTTTDSTLLIVTLSGAAIPVATDLDGATTHYTAIVADSTAGGKWFHFAPHQIQSQGRILLRKAVEWIRNWSPLNEWDLQVGEFMIDSIKEANRPRILNVSTRDYTKKMLNSKLEKSISFAAGTSVVTIVQALAANSGITKMKLLAGPTAGIGAGGVIPARIDLERGTSRWQVAKDICSAAGFELYFDREGYLVMREFIDPSFGPISHTFKTGNLSDGGNLVTYERSTNDSRLFNHIVVVGERENETLMPFFGEVKNTNPGSPTSIDKIGDRMADPIVGTYFKSNADCLEYAHNRLKISALESYELNFSSIVYQWLEVGGVVEILDPDRIPTDPTRYLLDTLVLPMGLGPMSGTGKRVTIVQDDDYVLTINDPRDPVLVP